MNRRTASLLLVLTVLVGCSRPGSDPVMHPKPPPNPSLEDPPAPGTEPQEPAQESGPSSAVLLPEPNTPLHYRLSDRGDQLVQEFYVRDGERLIGSYNGKVYVTWFITPEGVFRKDPKGPALLRYLPPALGSDMSWKQQSGDAEVWFRLLATTGCYFVKSTESCWELTVLNRQEQTRFQFAEGRGIVWADSLHTAKPADSFMKSLTVGKAVPAPAADAMIRAGAERPDGPLPGVTEVSLAAFEQHRRAMLKAGGALLEIDLDQDGRPERIEGPPGIWHFGPYTLYNADGRVMKNALYNNTRLQHRLEIVTLAGMDRPTLLYALSIRDGWKVIYPLLMVNGSLREAWDGAPKIIGTWAGDARVAADGTLAVTGVPEQLGGYAWTRYYRIVLPGEANQRPWTTQLVRETWEAGPYPATPEDLLTAALIARWWDLEEDLARYIPDEAVRAAFKETEMKRPPDRPGKAKVGRLSFGTHPTAQGSMPILEPAPPGVDGSADFLVEVDLYEGYRYHTGKVTFGTEADGRLVIRRLELERIGSVY